MKICIATIQDFDEDKFFKPVRDKLDFARVVLYASRILLLNMKFETNRLTHFKVVVNKMSRLFFFKENKFYSISFPFILDLEGQNIASIKTRTGIDVDSMTISQCLAILNDDRFIQYPSINTYWLNSNNSDLPNGFELLEELLLCEPAYIRYDNDPANENGKVHPLDHLDVNFSSYGNYKIGLKSALKDVIFLDLLDSTTNCSYLE